MNAKKAKKLRKIARETPTEVTGMYLTRGKNKTTFLLAPGCERWIVKQLKEKFA